MRWQGQTLAEADEGVLPGLSVRVPGLVRVTTTPDFKDVRFHEVLAKSVLNKVPDGSNVPFRWTINPFRGCAHACSYCLDGDTEIWMADGSSKALRDIRPGDRIVGAQQIGKYRRLVATEVSQQWRTLKAAYEIRLADGTTLIASGDHRFLTERGWKHVAPAARGEAQRPYLTTNNSLVGFGAAGPTPHQGQEYRRGYLSGMVRGDGHLGIYSYPERRRGGGKTQHIFRLALKDVEALDRSRLYLGDFGVETNVRPFATPDIPGRSPMAQIETRRRENFERINEIIEWPRYGSSDWQAGFAAGIFDAEGTYTRGILRISNSDEQLLRSTEAAMCALGLESVRDAVRPNGVTNVRLRGGQVQAYRFFGRVRPAITRKCSLLGQTVRNQADLRITSIRYLGLEIPMFDITTGTGNFFANGVISHNCYARSSHSYLGLDTGRDFEREIVVKVNAPEVLRRELARKSWGREHVALGTNTDPYQRAEGRYQLMPGILTALADSGTPLSVLTKGTLLKRDIPLLRAISEQVPVGLGVSLAIYDEPLQQLLEPGTPGIRARLDLVRALRAADLPCGVFLAPVLPGLTDSEEHLDKAFAALADAGVTGVTVVPLHLRPGAREEVFGWLRRERPDLVPLYSRLYRRGAYLPDDYRAFLAARVAPLLERHGLAGSKSGGLRGVPGDDDASFPPGSLPDLDGGPGSGRPTGGCAQSGVAEQLSLL